jgi:hypothetical protein
MLEGGDVLSKRSRFDTDLYPSLYIGVVGLWQRKVLKEVGDPGCIEFKFSNKACTAKGVGRSGTPSI